MSPTAIRAKPSDDLRYIPLSHTNSDSNGSALRLVLALYPEWGTSPGQVEFVRFTEGITNTLLKAVKRTPGASEAEIDEQAILLRAYGEGTDILIDREKETTSHSLLARHNLAPRLLARFQNGLIYEFMRGRVCTPDDLRLPPIYRGVARRLAEWHARLPIVASTIEQNAYVDPPLPGIVLKEKDLNISLQQAVRDIAPGKPKPNLWTVMQRWVFALPAGTEAEQKRKDSLQRELKRLVEELGDLGRLGADGLVFAHCDLLSGNVIIMPDDEGKKRDSEVETVHFIDYEYATPAPSAFDIANHFAEWGGFDCDFNVLPTRSQRKAFLKEYIHSYYLHSSSTDAVNLEAETNRLFDEVDHFRGVPGFYWGVWALIQATISQIDFDYANYAEIRLGEYWAWREEVDGIREREGKEKPLRERRWAQET